MVRRAGPEDYELVGRLLEEILDLHRDGRPDLFKAKEDSKGKYSREEFEELVKDDKAVIFIAEDEGKPAGYLICKIIEKGGNPVLKDLRTLYLDDLCVDKNSRGKGLGRALMEAAEDYARANGFYNVTLNVWGFNAGARGFYERLGYGVQRCEMEKVVGES